MCIYRLLRPTSNLHKMAIRRVRTIVCAVHVSMLAILGNTAASLQRIHEQLSSRRGEFVRSRSGAGVALLSAMWRSDRAVWSPFTSSATQRGNAAAKFATRPLPSDKPRDWSKSLMRTGCCLRKCWQICTSECDIRKNVATRLFH